MAGSIMKCFFLDADRAAILSLVDRTCLYHVGVRCHVSLLLILTLQYSEENPDFYSSLFRSRSEFY